MDHPILTDLLIPIIELYNDVKRKALMRLEYEGLHTAEAISLPGSRFHNDPAGYAMDRYAYYVCYKCNKVRFSIFFPNPVRMKLNKHIYLSKSVGNLSTRLNLIH